TALEEGPSVLGWSPDAAEMDAALAAGALDEAAPGPEAAAEDADLVVLAAPLDACLSLLTSLAPHLSGDRLITDVASLKAPLADAAVAAGVADRWVGAHPMCGSADSGFGASRTDLFVDARVWLCAHEEAHPHLPAIRRFWVSLGAVTAPVDPVDHDGLMARVSHLPQLTATALASALRDAGVTPDQLGPGALDMTRLAGSSPEIWRDILAWAPAELPGHLRTTAARLEELADLVGEGDTEALARRLAASRAWRRGS
ncbi:MAG TPA: prephenate dehydrogenase/arogenate dehydrogenase family protein, partial [Longimicrobiales bacterium]|nr:prephenate dehydrogenase/arogenate dehydrogenase family protein [Longimicrobiales bacterium]